MKEFEFINPHDPYTFEAEDLEIAALVVFTFGTAYGARTKSGEEEVPILIFGGAIEWYQEHFGRTPDEGMEARHDSLARALGSMMYGHFEDRYKYNAALEAITDPEKRDVFIEKWQDGCSSLNEIGKRAHILSRIMLTKEDGHERDPI